VLAALLSGGRGGAVEIRAAERGGKRRILELAERNARLALDQEKLKAGAPAPAARRRAHGLQAALGLDALPVRIECFDISHLGGTHTVASMVVFEGGAPKKADYRRFTIRTVEGPTISPPWRGPRPPLRAVGDAARALAVRRRPRRSRSPRCRT
jgi:excinuclease ABC subunit C